MTTLILAHGWGQIAERWADRNGITQAAGLANVNLLLPQSTRWNRGWKPDDYQLLMDYMLDIPRPIILGGFSDGARPALLAADESRADGCIFHSGHWEANELPPQTHGLGFPLLCLGGRRDWTTMLPRSINTDPRGLARYYHDYAPVTWHEHGGGHSWGGVNRIIFDWIESHE